MSFVVVGGSIYGLFIAYHLINEGADVTIIDQTEPGGWSRAAVGLLEYRALGINIINTFSYLMLFINMIRKMMLQSIILIKIGYLNTLVNRLQNT